MANVTRKPRHDRGCDPVRAGVVEGDVVKPNQSGMTIVAFIVTLTLAVAIVGGVVYVGLSAKRAVEHIGGKYSNEVDQTEFVFHSRYDRCPTGKPGQVALGITDDQADTFGQWRIDRSTNLVHWTPIFSEWTDRESAVFLRDMFLAVEMATSAEGQAFFRARRDAQP